MNIKEALTDLRRNEKRKFNQSVDLIVNLKGIDAKKENISGIITIPHKFKEKKVAAFLAGKNESIKTITPPEFAKYKDKKELKNLVKNYDFFISSAKLMPSVATVFGRVLGPAGKMPSPQLGVLMQEDESTIKSLLEKISKSVKIRISQPSIKLSIGNENMDDDMISKNFEAAYNGIVNMLPTKKENIKNAMIKLTMSKPIKVEVK